MIVSISIAPPDLDDEARRREDAKHVPYTRCVACGQQLYRVLAWRLDITWRADVTPERVTRRSACSQACAERFRAHCEETGRPHGRLYDPGPAKPRPRRWVSFPVYLLSPENTSRLAEMLRRVLTVEQLEALTKVVQEAIRG